MPTTTKRTRRPRGSDPIPIRAFRSPDDTWGPAMEVAKARGEPLSEPLNRFLRRYAASGKRELHDGEEPEQISA